MVGTKQTMLNPSRTTGNELRTFRRHWDAVMSVAF